MSSRAALRHPLTQEDDVVMNSWPYFRGERQLCVHESGCYRYAMVPPQGYEHNAPMCPSHATYADFAAYEDEIADKLAKANAHGRVFFCVACENPITLEKDKRSRAYRLPCCRTFVCGNCTVDVDATCSLCAQDLEVPKEKRYLKQYNVLTRPKPTPVEVDLTWGFVKTMVRHLEANQRVTIENFANQILALRKDCEGAERGVYIASWQDMADEYQKVLTSVIATVLAIPTFTAFRPIPSEAR